MKGIWILLLLILTAALPLIIVFVWFRYRKSPLTLPWFLAALIAGFISLFAAVLIQNFFPSPGRDRLGPVLFGVFVRIALVEEASRLVTLIPLFLTGKRRGSTDTTFGAALGLAAGLGFAALENAVYGTADIYITLLRAFTAAPLHGACGIRAGAAVFSSGKHPAKAFFLFVSAVIIHGAYNLMIVSPGFPSVLAAPAAYAALFASLSYIKTAGKDEDNPFPPKFPGARS